MSDEPTISFHVEADFDLKISEVFPDGEPDGWTADTVARIVAAYRSPERWMDEWCLTDDLDVDVSVTRPNPAYAARNGDDGPDLFGAPPPELWINEHRRIFPTWVADYERDA